MGGSIAREPDVRTCVTDETSGRNRFVTDEISSLNFIYVEFDYYFSYFISNIYNLKMCWYNSFVYNLYHELKEKEIWNRLNSKKDDYYILDFYGHMIFLK